MVTAEEYQHLWDTMLITDERTVIAAAKLCLAFKDKYLEVVEGTALRWQFVACIHNRESSLRFSRHLHNGDPLTARTTHVPAGRPKTGKPPFSWEESAKDAIFEVQEVPSQVALTLPQILYEFERYNGFGYQRWHPEVHSPYVWSMTNHYGTGESIGKFVADGHYKKFQDDGVTPLVDKQVGCAPLFRYLTDKTLADKLK